MQIATERDRANQRVAVVPITKDQWPLWRRLRLQALQEAPYAFGSKLADWQGPGDQDERWRGRLASVPLNLVAFLDNIPVGMASATEPNQDRTAELISMWVAPSVRGQGVGIALLEAVVEWAQRQEALYLSLEVTQNNEHAVNLYFRYGFVDSGNLVPTGSEDCPERRLTRTLAAST